MSAALSARSVESGLSFRGDRRGDPTRHWLDFDRAAYSLPQASGLVDPYLVPNGQARKPSSLVEGLLDVRSNGFTFSHFSESVL
jgi:hypothetical protein